MEQFIKFMTIIRNLSKKEFDRALALFLSVILMIALGIVYYIWTTSSSYIDQIIGLQRLSDKAALVLSENDQLEQEQQRLQALFDQEKDFSIKAYFEQFYKQLNIAPEVGWNDSSTDIGDKFTQITLQATFKGQTMQKVTQIIDTLDKKDTIYLKEVTIRGEPNQRVTLELKIGTIRPKKKIGT